MNKKDFDLQRAERLVEIINESAQIAKESNNSETKLSRLDLAIKHLYEVKDLANKYQEIKITQLNKLDFQLTEMKYNLLKDNF
jgi:hypothetical protein